MTTAGQGSGTERVTPCPLCPETAAVPVRVLASGVDTLHLSARGVLRPELWDELEAAREQAQADEESVPVELDRTGHVGDHE